MGCKPVFIFGSGRSGTTLFKDLLNSHPDIKIPPESHFLLELRALYGDPRTPEQAVRILNRLRRHYRFRRFQLDIRDEEAASARNYAELIDIVYTAFARKHGSQRWGDKTPHYVHHAKHLADLFPNARFVHMVRDGRDVCLSVIRREWGPANLYTAAKYWTRAVEAGLQAEKDLGPRCRRIRYESLLQEPETVLREFCTFAQLPFTEALLTPTSLPEDSYIDEDRDVFGRRNSPRVSRTKLVSGNFDKWKKVLSEQDHAVINAVAGKSLEALGYTPASVGHTPPGPWRRKAYEITSLAMMTWRELTSRDIYRRMANRDTFPIWHSSRRILAAKPPRPARNEASAP